MGDINTDYKNDPRGVSKEAMQEQEMRMQRAEQKPMSPQKEKREMIAAVLIGAFLGYLITEVIFAGYK